MAFGVKESENFIAVTANREKCTLWTCTSSNASEYVCEGVTSSGALCYNATRQRERDLQCFDAYFIAFTWSDLRSS
jgi:hypothetical protein